VRVRRFTEGEDKKWCAPLPGEQRNVFIDDPVASGPGYGEFRTDYEPIPARIARARSCSSNGGSACAVIVDHSNPGAWHGTSASVPATTVHCTTDAEVLDGILGALDTHEFVFARLTGLANALGVLPRFSLGLSYWFLVSHDQLTCPLPQGSRQRQQKTQKTRATTLWQRIRILLILIPHSHLSHNRHRRRMSYLRPSQATHKP